MIKKRKKKIIIKAFLLRLLILTIILAGLIIGSLYAKQKLIAQKTPEPSPTISQEKSKDIYIDFLLEIHDKIQENYWKKIPDEELTTLYKLALEKANEQMANAENQIPTKNSPLAVSGAGTKLESILAAKFKNLNDEDKKEFTIQISSLVLANLQPFGRSGLYTTKKVQELSNRVKNVDPTADLYQELEVQRDAPQEIIEQTYQEKAQKLTQKIEELEKKEVLTPEEIEQKKQSEQKLAQIDRAHETLSIPEKREKYDQAGIEATTKSNLAAPGIPYLQIKRFSPTTYEEFINDLDRLEDLKNLKYLILDFRANIGGSIDYLPYFLGLFLGNNQYAYDWFHQDEYTPFRTKVEKMPIVNQLKDIIILADNETQSSAEVMIATLKKYNLGTFVGTNTKGWGTIEKVFPLENQIDPNNETFSVFLVHSVTLRDNDGQPLEGRGVDPDINVNDENWEQQLLNYYENQELVATIKKLWGK